MYMYKHSFDTSEVVYSFKVLSELFLAQSQVSSSREDAYTNSQCVCMYIVHLSL